MVKAIINIDEHTNQILNIVKAKFGLNDKSQAIQKMALEYEENVLEQKLRPEYVKKLDKIANRKGIPFKSMEEYRRHLDES